MLVVVLFNHPSHIQMSYRIRFLGFVFLVTKLSGSFFRPIGGLQNCEEAGARYSQFLQMKTPRHSKMAPDDKEIDASAKHVWTHCGVLFNYAAG